MKKKVLIVGPAASGKDYLRSVLVKGGFVPGVFCTTRPRRDGEKNGEEYFFLNGNEEMQEQPVVWHSYNNWMYWLAREQWENGGVFIFTPEYLSQLNKDERNQCVVVYVCPCWLVRFWRLIRRGGADRVARRMLADMKQFRNFKDYDIKITNSKF